jgi:hypothetical protein
VRRGAGAEQRRLAAGLEQLRDLRHVCCKGVDQLGLLLGQLGSNGLALQQALK